MVIFFVRLTARVLREMSDFNENIQQHCCLIFRNRFPRTTLLLGPNNGVMFANWLQLVVEEWDAVQHNSSLPFVKSGARAFVHFFDSQTRQHNFSIVTRITQSRRPSAFFLLHIKFKLLSAYITCTICAYLR